MAKDNLILTKSADFAVQIYHLGKFLREQREFELSSQVFRSGTSIGANIEEAIGGISRKDFIAKLGISYKEARETLYWLKLIKKVELPVSNIAELISECESIIKILSAILISSKTNNP